MKTLYRRNLPTPPAVAFSSECGKQMFQQALADGFMEGYFSLAEQFLTQAEPAYCGLTTLTMVLNTLSVDPGQTWKGVWRWYSDDMLHCCRPLELVQKNGVTFDEFICLGRCHFLHMDAKRPLFVNKSGSETDTEYKTCDLTCASDCCKDMFYPLNEASIDEFRSDIIKSTCLSTEPVLIVSYSRKQLKQTGDGHFSPIAGYHSENDMVLIMDVARYKYPPHWIAVETLFEAMCSFDKVSNKTRGWVLCSKQINSDNGIEMIPLFFRWHIDSFCNDTNMPNFFLKPIAEITLNIIISIKNGSFTENCSHAVEEKSTLNSVADNFQKAVECLLTCLPNDFYQCIKIDSEFSNKNYLIKERIVKGIHSNGLYELLKNKKLPWPKGIECSNGEMLLESVTIILLVLLTYDTDLPLEQLSDEVEYIKSITDIDRSCFPELHNEVKGLQHQFSTMQAYAKNQSPRDILD